MPPKRVMHSDKLYKAWRWIKQNNECVIRNNDMIDTLSAISVVVRSDGHILLRMPNDSIPVTPAAAFFSAPDLIDAVFLSNRNRLGGYNHIKTTISQLISFQVFCTMIPTACQITFSARRFTSHDLAINQGAAQFQKRIAMHSDQEE